MFSLWNKEDQGINLIQWLILLNHTCIALRAQLLEARTTHVTSA